MCSDIVATGAAQKYQRTMGGSAASARAVVHAAIDWVPVTMAIDTTHMIQSDTITDFL